VLRVELVVCGIEPQRWSCWVSTLRATIPSLARGRPARSACGGARARQGKPSRWEPGAACALHTLPLAGAARGDACDGGRGLRRRPVL